MAQHLRHELARRRVLVRPQRIQTLVRFLEPWTPWKAPSPAMLALLADEALARLRRPEFAAVADFRGFHRAVAELLEELPSARLAGPFGEPLEAVAREIEAQLARRGLALRHARLAAAAESIRNAPAFCHTHVFVDGFFSLATPERAVLEAIATRASLHVAQPERRPARAPQRALFSAPTLEQELEEIARRILERAARGGAFREIGVIVRARDPYVPALESTLARFGIPARFYFAGPLAAHPALQFLSGIVRALVEGWDHEKLLAVLRMPIAGGGTDEFDFALRERLPGHALEALMELPGAPPLLARLAEIERWREARVSAEEWAARASTLRQLVPAPQIRDGVSHEQAARWRSLATALDAFEAALEETALLGGEPSLAEFWKRAEGVFELTPLHVADHRRNVVHVIDAREAHQWEIPVVFVCGLVERQFPQHHRQSPLLSDAARARLGIPTSADRQREERLLFEAACASATEQLILSYPQFDENGEDLIRSLFLAGDATPVEQRVRPAPLGPRAPDPVSAIRDADLLQRLAAQHRTLAPTHIESYLQCPFQFFAARTLRLRPRPPAPRDRLDIMLQGSILHRTLAEWTRAPLLGPAVFDEIFADECRRHRVPPSYRREAVRLELLRHFERFLADGRLSPGWDTRVEEEFTFTLEGVTFRGRIDRLEVGPGGQALIIDYKYSGASQIRERVEQNAAGNLVQGGLYLLAAERALGLKAAGMLYCGLRKEVAWEGWHAPIAGLETIGEVCGSAALGELMSNAAASALAVYQGITEGRILPAPADEDKCQWCDFRDICRIESRAGLAAEAAR